MARGEPLRIVHVLRAPMGGLFRHVRDLAMAHQAEGHHVGVICDAPGPPGYNEAMADELAGNLSLGLHRAPMRREVGVGDIKNAGTILKIMKNLQPDVLHGHGAKGGVYARALGSLVRVKRSRVARLYSPHGGSLHYDEDTLVGKVFFLLERIMARATDHLLFVSDYERQTYFRKVGRPRAATSLVYNGLLPAEFEPVPPTAGAADFLYIGMMRDLKGPDIFVDALALAQKDAARPLTAVMVGDGDDLPRYRDQVSRLGLGSQIAFHPAMPARQAFALARIVVVPSRAEAMPYIVLEALAAGKPMIASAVGGIPEIFGPGSRALVDPDPTQVAGKMVVALGDEASYAAAMPARDDLRSRFGADVMAANIEAAYRQALGEG